MDANTTEEGKLMGLIDYNPVWVWMMIFIVLGMIFLTVFFYLKIKPNKIDEPKNKVVPMQVGFAEEIDRAFLLVSNRQITLQEACQRVSIVLREYISHKTGMDASTMTLTALERSNMPAPLVHNIEYIYPVIFGNREISTYEDFLQFMNSSRTILDGTWN